MKNVIRGEKPKKKKKSIMNMLPEENKLWKGFSSMKNSYVNHLLRDLVFKQ